MLEANGRDLKFVTVDDAASIISVSLASKLFETRGILELVNQHAHSVNICQFICMSP